MDSVAGTHRHPETDLHAEANLHPTAHAHSQGDIRYSQSYMDTKAKAYS